MTETSKSRGVTAIPYTFSLMPDLTVHSLYCGYWYVGRPTLDELRMDLRAMMKKSTDPTSILKLRQRPLN